MDRGRPEVQKAKDELEERVLERTEDLRKANLTLERRISQLRFLNSVSDRLAQFILLPDVCRAVASAFVERLPGAEASLCLFARDVFSCVCSTEGLQSPEAAIASEKTLESVASVKLTESLIIDRSKDKAASSVFSEHGPELYPFLILLPLISDKTLLGVVEVLATNLHVAAFESDREIFTLLSSHAAACVGKALHLRELGEKARLQGELDAARSIQRRFIPSHIPQIPRIKLKGAYFPANEISGDYLDYFMLPSGRWVIVIADVCGKGVPAALVMAMLRSTFRAEAERMDASSARELMVAVNEHFVSNLDVSSFVTALCLVIREDGSAMSYARAGHPPLLHIASGSLEPQPVHCKGIAFGLLGDNESFISQTQEVTIPLHQGDRFFIYTDGLIDAGNPQDESYGLERLYPALGQRAHSDPAEIVDGILADVRKFSSGAPNYDDLTVLAMSVTG